MVFRYLGYQSSAREGLLLAEANQGNLQLYIDKHHSAMSAQLRQKWCRQAVEAVDFLHQKGVIHSDLRLENYLVHMANGSTDLWLCDFGGSTCQGLGLDGGHLPDDPFFDPRLASGSTPAIDIFSLASILYTILTGHWPHKAPGEFQSHIELWEYQMTVNSLFMQEQYPDTTGLFYGDVVKGCWTSRYKSTTEVLWEMDATRLQVDDDGEHSGPLSSGQLWEQMYCTITTPPSKEKNCLPPTSNAHV